MAAGDERNPMEVRATGRQLQALLKRHPKTSYLVFPEDRTFPVRRRDILPRRWAGGPSDTFTGQARPGEWYALQLGVYAARKALADIGLTFTDLKTAADAVIPKAAFGCINLGGTDWRGRSFSKAVDVPKGEVQALWIGVQVPDDACGCYKGSITVRPKGAEPTRVKIVLDVAGKVLRDHGDGDLWRHARLRWLDSTLGIDDEPIEPFTLLRVRNRSIHCLGRTVKLGPGGFPESIVSRFSRSVTRIEKKGRELLARPMTFVVETADGPAVCATGRPKILTRSRGSVTWRSKTRSKALSLTVSGRMEFDGYLKCEVKLKANRSLRLRDVRLEVPFNGAAACYIVSMGRRGGLRRGPLRWKWDAAKQQDAVWMGDVNVGLRCQLYGENYQRPLCNAHYKHGPLNLPKSWHNGGRGGCSIRDEADGVTLLNATSGRRTMKPGETLRFCVGFHVTPFKPLDTDGHWERRFFHVCRPLDPAKRVAGSGASVVNIHQSPVENPFINYPFDAEVVADLRSYIDSVHREGVRAKIYYTVRELSIRAAEIWALRTLGQEILLGGDGRGYFAPKKKDLARYPWCREHLRTDYTVAWRDELTGKYEGQLDESILTASMSRWHNYYLEGLAWLCEHAKIDGLYIDDLSYDRGVMQRVRRVLDRFRPGHAGIDLHSADNWIPAAGWASCVNTYMEHLPYIERLWFGEGFDYQTTSPDYWLIEMSGIPFGLMGEMLWGGGNPWRGMVFGMTSRLGWGGDPRNLWKVWDDFGMRGSEMIAWWDEACPVKTGRDDVLATVYRRRGSSLVAVASWADEPADVTLGVDWKALGIAPGKARIDAPEVAGFQHKEHFRPGDAIRIEPGKGRLLVFGASRR